MRLGITSGGFLPRQIWTAGLAAAGRHPLTKLVHPLGPEHRPTQPRGVQRERGAERDAQINHALFASQQCAAPPSARGDQPKASPCGQQVGIGHWDPLTRS